VKFDKLLEELLLAAAEPLSAPFVADGMSTVANRMAGGLMDWVGGNGNGNGQPDSQQGSLNQFPLPKEDFEQPDLQQDSFNQFQSPNEEFENPDILGGVRTMTISQP